MPCYTPLKAFRTRDPDSLKLNITFDDKNPDIIFPIQLPCGQCIGCRLEYARQWAVRCVHEAQLHEKNCFLTLTFNNENLSPNFSLDKSDFQKFMKRLRKKYPKDSYGRISYYMCGEYGENFGRPHYHAIIFNFDVPDRVLFSQRNGVNLYSSEILSSLWPYGFCSVGDVTFESAAYVARYVMKKVTGKDADDYYTFIHPITGQAVTRSPEYTTMSRRPGIGKGWIDNFIDDVFPGDFVVVNGVKCRPPRFYDNVYDVLQSGDSFLNKKARVRRAKLHACDNTDKRLLTRLEVCEHRVSLLKRGL